MIKSNIFNFSKEIEMSEQRKNEKEEEKREKEDEKRSEKSWDEKWRHNPVRAATMAIILIWGGIVALISVGDIVSISWWKGWPVFLVGTGIILLVKAAIRMMPEQRRSVGGTVIIGLILLGVGLGDLLSWVYVGPVFLILIGVVLIFGIFFRRRNS
jgi:hypothetical protein